MKTIFLLSILMSFYCPDEIPGTLTGKYRLNYTPKSYGRTGWDYHQRSLEELMTLRDDSIFIIERIRPQGGFEVLPQTGHWRFNNGTLTLTGDRYPRFFKWDKTGWREPGCARRDIRNILWKKEE